MHVGTTFTQQFSNSVLLPSSFIHQIRSPMIRRYCGDRICLFMSVLLVFYIVWNVYNVSKPTLRYDHDPAEELAYTKAMNSSSPIEENTQLCSSDKIDLIFLIISSNSHFLDRQSIRETWGSMPDLFGVRSQRLFVVGYRMGDHFYKDISSEATHERDLLYLTVNDYLTTLKEIHAYRWLDQHCSNVTYMFKTEDDLFVNSLLLHELVRELKTKPNDVKNRVLYNMQLDSMFACQKDQFLFGWAFQPSEPERIITNSAYYVSKEEYSKDMYPQYCSGLCSFFYLYIFIIYLLQRFWVFHDFSNKTCAYYRSFQKPISISFFCYFHNWHFA